LTTYAPHWRHHAVPAVNDTARRGDVTDLVDQSSRQCADCPTDRPTADRGAMGPAPIEASSRRSGRHRSRSSLAGVRCYLEFRTRVGQTSTRTRTTMRCRSSTPRRRVASLAITDNSRETIRRRTDARPAALLAAVRRQLLVIAFSVLDVSYINRRPIRYTMITEPASLKLAHNLPRLLPRHRSRSFHDVGDSNHGDVPPRPEHTIHFLLSDARPLLMLLLLLLLLLLQVQFNMLSMERSVDDFFRQWKPTLAMM